MAFENRPAASTHAWTAPSVWGTAPPKSPTQGTVSSFFGQEYTPSSPPSSRSRPRSLTLLMNTFSSNHHNQQSAPPPPTLPQIDEEPRRVYPTLHEVLHNTSPPPYTLSSFMAYLSMMHSLETLEFLLDASRYRSMYIQTLTNLSSPSVLQPSHPEIDRVKIMWSRLIDAYVRPGGSREVNLPGELRDTLLTASIECIPPSPELLDPSITHVYNLMREGVLASFISSCDANAHMSSPGTAKSESSFTRSLWNKSPAGFRSRNSSGSGSCGGNSSRSSASELLTPITSFSSTSQPISIPYPITSAHRSPFMPPMARSVGGLLSHSTTNHYDDSRLDAWLESTSDEMSDVDEGSIGHRSSSGRASPMTPPLTPQPSGEGSPVREGGIWGRVVRERLKFRRS